MKTISISKFKATCLKEIDILSHTGEPIVITKFGKPVAMLVEHSEEKKSDVGHGLFGCMKGQMKTIGDIVSPVGEEDWEALQ